MLFLPQSLPTQPAPYHLLGSGPDRRWWRGLLAVIFLVVSALIASFAVSLLPIFFINTDAYFSSLNQLVQGTLDLSDPVMFTVMMATLIVLIPLAFIATVISQRIKPGFLLSVEGRLRWKWQLVSFAVSAVIFFPWIIGMTWLSEDLSLNLPPNLWLVLALVWLLTPLQCAAEELVFRGFILQTIGTWIRRPILSLLIGIIVSAFAFAAAHGSFDPSTMLSLMLMAFAACLATWYTGGLEAGIAIHTANNTAIFTLVALTGPADVIVSSDTSVGWGASFLAGAVDLVTVGILIWLAKVMNIRRVHRPEDAPKPTVDYLLSEWSKGRLHSNLAAYYPPAFAERIGLTVPASEESHRAAHAAPLPRTSAHPHQPY